MKASSVLVLFVMFFLFFHAPKAFARLEIDQRDYNQAWKNYLAGDSSKKPDRIYQYEDCFKKAAQENDLPFSLVLAVARGESFFNPKAMSKKSCYGIMQIQWPGTAKDMGITSLTDLMDPCKNIAAGAKYLRLLMNRYDDNIHLALAGYNHGPGAIGKNPSVDDIPEGAQWYSGYIHHHLEKILKKNVPAGKPIKITPGYPEQKLEIIAFNQPYRAKGFYDTIQARASSINLDWFRSGPGRFQVVMLYNSDAELNSGLQVLNDLGFKNN
ncbi:lytic transglycosylase domain-containing protein [Desulfobacula toluolica]|uniref:Putative lytic transglycosylase n=1 Tax=Desulfobacula toluolica (strain DSM 7467 / Tol2) TaxID=651182 RepID=K0NL55_DESTT|nr:lytic transglycosylase domain-containing protein [Desulfobacula toluolica]CCK80693.1 putative lytic transglycosylase [Desulfobacula toluolica Tol2]